MVIAEEESTGAKDSHDIDLKCAEKVTDSDNEENLEAAESKVSTETITITVTGTTTATTLAPTQTETTASNDNNQQQDGNGARDITCKPKPIKAQRQTIDSPLLKYQPVYLNAYSPKNPTGILPFQPTGEWKIPFNLLFFFRFVDTIKYCNVYCHIIRQVVLLKRCQSVQKM